MKRIFTIVLLFIGVKMLLPMLAYLGVSEKYLHLPEWASLAVIVVCISGSIVYSMYNKKEGSPDDFEESIEPVNNIDNK